MNLLPADVNRPLSDIRPNFDLPSLEVAILEAIETVTLVEREVQDRQGTLVLAAHPALQDPGQPDRRRGDGPGGHRRPEARRRGGRPGPRLRGRHHRDGARASPRAGRGTAGGEGEPQLLRLLPGEAGGDGRPVPQRAGRRPVGLPGAGRSAAGHPRGQPRGPGFRGGARAPGDGPPDDGAQRPPGVAGWARSGEDPGRHGGPDGGQAGGGGARPADRPRAAGGPPGRGGQPAQGRVPGHGLARAARPLERHGWMGPRAGGEPGERADRSPAGWRRSSATSRRRRGSSKTCWTPPGSRRGSCACPPA